MGVFLNLQQNKNSPALALDKGKLMGRNKSKCNR
jgi:hypothetical protein